MTSSRSASAPTDPPSYVARTPVDLIALVPFVLGFHPAESVVVLTFGSPHGAFHARVDLPHGRAERVRVVATLRDAVIGNGATTAVVLVFSTNDAAARRISADLVPALLHVDVEVIDAIRADGEHWWCVGPADPVPDRGPGHPYDLSTHPFTAARVLEGHAAFADRESLAASLLPAMTPDAVADRAEVNHEADRAADVVRALAGSPASLRASARWLLEVVTGFDEDHGNGARPGPATAARIGVLVALPDMREVICTVLRRPGAAGQVSGWRDLLVRMPGDLVPGVAAVLALAAWLAGEVALAWVAIDRCVAHAPEGEEGQRVGRSLADRVAERLQAAQPPSGWRPLPRSEVALLRDGAG